MPHGGRHWNEAIALRDFLRSHPDQARHYADSKRNSLSTGSTLLRYAEAKSKLIEDLLQHSAAP